MMIEAPADLVRVIESYRQQISDAEDYVNRLRAERQEALNIEARKLAEFQIGQRVRTNKHEYEITKIEGWMFTFSNSMGITPQLRIEYSGRQVLANGALGAREKQIFDFKAVDGAQTAQKVSEAVSEAEG